MKPVTEGPADDTEMPDEIDFSNGVRGLHSIPAGAEIVAPASNREGLPARTWHNQGMESVVVRDPEIMSGQPVFRGTRVLLRTLFDYLEEGHSIERFLKGFPTVSREAALQALEEAQESLLANHGRKPNKHFGGRFLAHLRAVKEVLAVGWRSNCSKGLRGPS